MKRIALWAAAAACIALAGAVVGCRTTAPPLGTPGGRLTPCPGTPNCVNSQDPDARFQIAPIAYTGDGAKALELLRNVILAQPRTRLTEFKDGYMRFEFKTRVFRFVDDVEFLLDRYNKVIQVRSASRLGHSDLGLNRRRVEKLRGLFAQAQNQQPSR